MRYDVAVKLHAELLVGAGKHRGGPIVEAVVRLHAPVGVPACPADEPNCHGCPPGGYAESENAWEDCLTLKTMNTWFQVNDYPTGVEAPEPVTCTPAASSSCPVHGRCSCRVEYRPYRVIPARACPLHGEAGTHSYSNGPRRQW
jgi:hypothetical protein